MRTRYIYGELNELQQSQRGTHTTKRKQNKSTRENENLRNSSTVEKGESSVEGRVIDVPVTLANAASGDVN